MKKYKVNLTRPEFMDVFLDNYTMETMDPIIPDQCNLIYTIYSVLLESNLKRSDIKQVSCDGETVVVKLSSKTMVKDVVSKFHKEIIRFGVKYYKIHMKTDRCYLYVDLIETEAPTYDTLDNNASEVSQFV